MTPTQIFFCGFNEIFKSAFFTEHLRATTSALTSFWSPSSDQTWRKICRSKVMLLCYTFKRPNAVFWRIAKSCAKFCKDCFLPVFFLPFQVYEISRKNSFTFRSSHKRCSIKKTVPKTSQYPQEKACNFIKKRLQHRCFPVNIAKFSWAPILKNICEWLLLYFYKKYILQLLFFMNLIANNLYII